MKTMISSAALVCALFVTGCTGSQGPTLARPNTDAVKSTARQTLGGNGMAATATFDAPVINANSTGAFNPGTGSFTVAPSTSGGPTSIGAVDTSQRPALQYVMIGDFNANASNFFAVLTDTSFTTGSHAIDNQHWFAGLFDGTTGDPIALASSGTVTLTTASGIGGRFVGSFNGTLDPVAASCQTTADCAAGEICSNGQCVTSPTPACRTNADCAAGQSCQAGVCVTNTPPPACVIDADCAANQVCVGGQCVTSTPPPVCTVDADCASNEQCLRGQCVPVSNPPQCTSNNQCPLGWACQSGQCVPGGNPGTCDGQQGFGAANGSVGTVASCAAIPASTVSLTQGMAMIDDQLRLMVFDGNTGDEGVILELAVCPGAAGTLTLGNGLVAASHVKDVQTTDLRLFAERRASSATLTLTRVSPTLAGSFALTLSAGGQVSGNFTMQ
ncbi:MAG: hypothetical protein U0228_24080 [Myxococcaceae bacterium]